MKNLMTQKHIFGVLMVFVLAFSITGTGIADPLRLTSRSDTIQEKRPNDAPFEIQFSVQPNGNIIAYNDASPRRRVTDGNTVGAEATSVTTIATNNRDQCYKNRQSGISGWDCQWYGTSTPS